MFDDYVTTKPTHSISSKKEKGIFEILTNEKENYILNLVF
jgi:hypothetical protein